MVGATRNLKGAFSMSFIKTLATLAVGFVAAKGVQKFQQSGGLAGMKDALRGAGQPGGMADQMGAMATKLGLPGGAAGMRDMMGKFGAGAAQATEQADAAMRAIDHVDLRQVTPASKALNQLKHLVENDVALALDVTIGFSDADGD